MKYQEFNYNSFMGVLGETRQDKDGVYIPGELMPSGKPIRANGVSKAAIMQDKGMATQWFESVKGAYEREDEERNHATSKPDAPDLVIGGGDTAPAEPAPRERAAPQASQTLEEELQARSARWESVMERAAAERDRAQQDYDEAKSEWKRAQRALDAVRSEE